MTDVKYIQFIQDTFERRMSINASAMGVGMILSLMLIVMNFKSKYSHRFTTVIAAIWMAILASVLFFNFHANEAFGKLGEAWE